MTNIPIFAFDAPKPASPGTLTLGQKPAQPRESDQKPATDKSNPVK